MTLLKELVIISTINFARKMLKSRFLFIMDLKVVKLKNAHHLGVKKGLKRVME